MWYLSSLTEFFVRQTALEGARLETKMLDEVWRFYSDEISDIDPKVANIAITENYRHVHPSLPLPATFAIDLGERISRRSPGMEVRVFSRWPWPTRKDGGPQSEVDRAARYHALGGERDAPRTARTGQPGGAADRVDRVAGVLERERDRALGALAGDAQAARRHAQRALGVGRRQAQAADEPVGGDDARALGLGRRLG